MPGQLTLFERGLLKKKLKHVTQLKIYFHKLLAVDENIFEIFCAFLCINYILLYTPHGALKFNSVESRIIQMKISSGSCYL